MDLQYKLLCDQHMCPSTEGLMFCLVPYFHNVEDQKLYVQLVQQNNGKLLDKNCVFKLKMCRKYIPVRSVQYNFDRLLELEES